MNYLVQIFRFDTKYFGHSTTGLLLENVHKQQSDVEGESGMCWKPLNNHKT